MKRRETNSQWYVKRYSESLFIMEVPIKVTIRYHFTSVRVDFIKIDIRTGKDLKAGNICTFIEGKVYLNSHYKN